MNVGGGTPAFTWRDPLELTIRMQEQVDELVESRDQMEQLVRVIVEIGSDLDVDVTVHRVVKAAMELTGARYGALGIRASDGTLASFVHAGIDDDTARRLGDLAVGEGLRVDDLSAHPQATALHAHDPPMRAFLGIPITVRAADFGSFPPSKRAQCGHWPPRPRPPSTTRDFSSENVNPRNGRKQVGRSRPRCCLAIHRQGRCSSS
jgi:hypothetical protein